MSIEIVCPSGFAGTARRWKGRELVTLADKLEEDEDVDAGGMSALLTGPWESTTDAGPYRFLAEGDAKPPWSRLLKGDVLASLWRMRMGSFRDGSSYDFDFQCERQPCRKKTEWNVDLTIILAREQKLPAETIDAMKTGQPLRTQLADGTEVTYRLGTLEVELEMNKLRAQQVKKGQRSSKQAGPVDMLAAQTLSVGGTAFDIRRRYNWAVELDLDDVLDLSQTYADSDCGFDTAIEVRCKHCRWVQEIELPLGKSFLVPKRKSRKDQEAESTTTTSRESSDQEPGTDIS